MDLAQPNGELGTTIRLYGISGAAFTDDSAYGCGNGGYQEFSVGLHAGETKECTLTIDDTRSQIIIVFLIICINGNGSDKVIRIVEN